MTPDEMLNDWLRRARIARACNEAGDRWPAWSTGELLAVAVILRDEEMLDDLTYTEADAIARLRFELGGSGRQAMTTAEAEEAFAVLRTRLDEPDRMRDQPPAEWWQGAVDAAYALLQLESARAYGLVTGGPNVIVEHAERLLATGSLLGFHPQSDAVERFVAEVADQASSAGSSASS